MEEILHNVPNTKITSSKIEWTPASSNDASLYFCGPSHNALIKQGDDSSAQIFGLGMGSALYFGSANKLSFSVKVSTTANYFHPTFLPKCYVDKNGSVSLEGTGTIASKSISAKMYLSGKSDGETLYVVLELTNNEASSITVTPTLIWADANLQNFRGDVVGYYGNADTDSVTWDATNKYLEITSPSISSIYAGIRACNTIQHYRVQTAYNDVNATYLSAGDLPDSIGTLGTTNYIWSQHGDTSNETTITTGATGTFTWVIGYKTSRAALQTLMAGLTSTPTSDLTTAASNFTATRLNVEMSHRDLGRFFKLTQGIMMGMANSQVIGSTQAVPAGTYTFTFPFSRDGYYSSKSLLQITGGSTIVSADYSFFKSYETAGHAQKHEIAQYVKDTGRFITSGNNGTPGDQDFYQILKAYEYYIATLDASFLSSEISTLNNIGSYINTFYTNNSKFNGLFAGHANSCYPDGANNFSGQTYIHEPMISSLAVYTLLALAELNTAAGDTSTATTWTNLANTMSASFSEFWNSSTNWPYVNITQTGTKYNSRHLTSVDIALWGSRFSTSYCQLMATQLVETTDWWDDTNMMFREMPTTDPNYSAGSYWLGKGWNLTDFKALELVFRYGTTTQAQIAFGYLKKLINKRMDEVKGYMGEHHSDAGMFGFSIGAFQEMIVRGLFGIEAHTTYFSISPTLYKLGIGNSSLSSFKMGNQTYSISVSGSGSNQKTYINGVLQSSNIIPYGAGTTISIVMSGRPATP